MIDPARLASDLADVRVRVAVLERRFEALERRFEALERAVECALATRTADESLAAGSKHDLLRRYRALFPKATKATVIRLLERGTCPDGAAPILAALRLAYGSAGPSRATVFRALSQQSHPETT